MAIKSIMTELKWFLRGSTDIRELRKEGCHIWDGDCYASYVRTCQWEFEVPMSKEEFFDLIDNNDSFGRTWGDMGPIYGAQWRNFGGLVKEGYGVDQLKNLLDTLKNNPDDRRMIVNAWNPQEISYMKLPPCHRSFQVWTRELTLDERYEIYKERLGSKFDTSDFKTHEKFDKADIPKRAISLQWDQRSVDTPLGLPFNIASYGMLLTLIAEEVNMIPEELIGVLGDVHVYQNQIDGVKQQRYNPMFPLPTVEIKSSNLLKGEFDYEIKNYVSCSPIKFPLSN